MAKVNFTDTELDEFAESFIERTQTDDADKEATKLRLQFFLNECVSDLIEDITWYIDGYEHRASFYRNWEQAERLGKTELRKRLAK